MDLLRAWLRGLVSWTPPPAVRTEFLIAWAIIAVVLALTFPLFLRAPIPGKIAVVSCLIVLAGAVNALFRKLGS
jgi:hypothetical protein